jgi:predicted heme/steroid binding protein
MPTKGQIFIFLIAPIVLAASVAYYIKPSMFNFSGLRTPTWDAGWSSPVVFTKEELSTKYNGKGGNPSYLVILGEVYDVSGAEYYKEGSGYSVFIGKDATTAFVTGKFDEGPSDDVMSLEAQQMKSIWDWIKFYRCVARSRIHSSARLGTIELTVNKPSERMKLTSSLGSFKVAITISLEGARLNG